MGDFQLETTHGVVWTRRPCLSKEWLLRMNRVFIRCPETGKMVFTGFAMDPKLFESFPELTEAFHFG